jgi:hypothetical protein
VCFCVLRELAFISATETRARRRSASASAPVKLLRKVVRVCGNEPYVSFAALRTPEGVAVGLRRSPEEMLQALHSHRAGAADLEQTGAPKVPAQKWALGRVPVPCRASYDRCTQPCASAYLDRVQCTSFATLPRRATLESRLMIASSAEPSLVPTPACVTSPSAPRAFRCTRACTHACIRMCSTAMRSSPRHDDSAAAPQRCIRSHPGGTSEACLVGRWMLTGRPRRAERAAGLVSP